MIKLRRSIYIGVGGTGGEILLGLRDIFTDKGRMPIPPMIAFLALDTNDGDLKKLPSSPNFKKKLLAASHDDAKSIYLKTPERYNWMPSQNVKYISSINKCGANQVRSNGRFLFEETQRSGEISTLLSQLKGIITSHHDNHGTDIYKDAQNTDIDVYLLFSIGGGTGSGAFLPLVYLIRNTLGDCNVIGYGLSHSMFESIGVKKHIKTNAYGALLELDYCMESERDKYQTIKFPGDEVLNRTPFDTFMYIDKNTYTRNSQEASLTRNRTDVIATVVNAIYLSGGSVGTENRSILNNLNALVRGAAGISQIVGGGSKSAWVSSTGTAELFCKENADVNSKAFQIAEKYATKLKCGISLDYAVWAKHLTDDIMHINEGGSIEDGDRDELIDFIMNPEKLSRLNPNNVTVLSNGSYTTVAIDQDKNRIVTDMEASKNLKREKCESELRESVINTLFPRTNDSQSTVGVDNVKTALDVFYSRVTNFKARLLSEIQDLENDKNQLLKDTEEIQTALKNPALYRTNNWKQQRQDEIANNVREMAVLDMEISRRTKAIEIYDSLLDKSNDLSKKLQIVSERLNATISSLASKRADLDRANTSDKGSNAIKIDISRYMERQVSKDELEQNTLDDWRDFYESALMSKTIGELASIVDWSTYLTEYVKKKFPTETAPIILRALDKKFKEEERLKAEKTFTEADSVIGNLVDAARPLMDINNHGDVDAVDVSNLMYVSMPETTDEYLLNKIKTAFKEKMGETVEFITHAKNNSIYVFQQIGVVSPYFITGVSYVHEDRQSAEYAYNNLSEVDYSPFIDNQFIKAVKNSGHSLGREIRDTVDEDMQRWVYTIILGIMQRGGDSNSYRVESEDGILDTTTFIPMKTFGGDRVQAFQSFSDESVQFKTEMDERIEEAKKTEEGKKILEDLKKAGKIGYAAKYITISMVDREAGEMGSSENKHQLTKEAECLKKILFLN